MLALPIPLCGGFPYCMVGLMWHLRECYFLSHVRPLTVILTSTIKYPFLKLQLSSRLHLSVYAPKHRGERDFKELVSYTNVNTFNGNKPQHGQIFIVP